MKRIILSLACLSMLALAIQTQAQDDRKIRTDQTYSTHNYKHANKAAVARRWEGQSGIAVQEPTSAAVRVADYKKTDPNAQSAGGVSVDHTPSVSLADRNYKLQQEGNTTNVNADRLAKQRKRQTETTPVVGHD